VGSGSNGANFRVVSVFELKLAPFGSGFLDEGENQPQMNKMKADGEDGRSILDP
jgi:hypothetical protein